MYFLGEIDICDMRCCCSTICLFLDHDLARSKWTVETGWKDCRLPRDDLITPKGCVLFWPRVEPKRVLRALAQPSGNPPTFPQKPQRGGPRPYDNRLNFSTIVHRLRTHVVRTICDTHLRIDTHRRAALVPRFAAPWAEIGAPLRGSWSGTDRLVGGGKRIGVQESDVHRCNFAPVHLRASVPP